MDVPFVRITVGKIGVQGGDVFTVGDGKLINASVTLAEGKVQSSCTFTVLDPDRKLADKYFSYVEQVQGLDPVLAPKQKVPAVNSINNPVINNSASPEQSNQTPGKVIYENTVASTYGHGSKYDGGDTGAYGDKIDFKAMTAAMFDRKYKYALMRVTQLSSGRSIVVKINDRGPFLITNGKADDTQPHPTRKIDLTAGAWAALTNGAAPDITNVKIEWLQSGDTTSASSNSSLSTQKAAQNQIAASKKAELTSNTEERISDWPSPGVAATKSIILTPGHRIDIASGTNGTNSSNIDYNGQNRTVESVATEIASQVFTSVLRNAGYTIINPPPLPSATTTAARQQYQTEIANIKQSTGAYALELHFDDATAGVIQGGKYDKSGKSLNVMDVAIAKEFGAYKFAWGYLGRDVTNFTNPAADPNSLGAATKGITILEIAPLDANLTNLTVTGAANNNMQPLKDALLPYAQRLLKALNTVVTEVAPANTQAAASVKNNIVQQETIPQVRTLNGAQITIELGFNGEVISAHSFIHTGLRFSLFEPNALQFIGQAATWVMTQRVKNTVYTNMSFKKIAQRITNSYGLNLEMKDEGPTYTYFPQRGQTDYEALLIEARRIGYRVYTKGPTVYIYDRGGVLADKQIFILSYGENLGIVFQVQHQAQTDTTGGARSSIPGSNNSTGTRKFEVDPNTGKLNQVRKENIIGVGRDGAIATTGSAIPPPIPKTTGVTDVADSNRTANLNRVQGITASAELVTTYEALTLDPDTPLKTENISVFFDRMWVIDKVTHEYQTGKLTTKLAIYSPLKNKKSHTNPNITAITNPVIAPVKSDRSVESALATGYYYLLAIRTGSRDQYGLELLNVILIDPSGDNKGTINACSGVRTNQVFKGPGQTTSGSLAPCEEGLYNLGSPVPGASAGVGEIFIPLNPTFTTSRSAIGFHNDANRSTSPGSAGCIATHTLKEFNIAKKWISDYSITKFRCYWGVDPTFGQSIKNSTVVVTGQSTGYIVPTRGVITSPFGPRGTRIHKGIDIGTPVGTPVLAAQSGTVTTAGLVDPNGYGNLVTIAHPNNESTRYAHLSSIQVSVGDTVTQGQQIGLSGGRKGAYGSGSSSGDHLHFEILSNGTQIDPASKINLPGKGGRI